MIRTFRWIFLAANCLGITRAAETFAYHFGSVPFESHEVEAAPVVNGAPTANPFVTAGDRLLDLSSHFRNKGNTPKDSWVIWNQTRRLLIVHGSVMDQWRVEMASGFQEQPLQVRLAVDWLRSGETSEEDVQFASVSSISRSAQESETSAQLPDDDGDWTFKVDAQPTILEHRNLNCGFNIEWNGPDGGHSGQGKLSTSVLLADGGSQTLASWHADGCGPEFRFVVRSEILLTDGTLLREARLRQTGDRVVKVDSSAPGISAGRFTDFPNPTPRKIKAMKVPRQWVLSWPHGLEQPSESRAPFTAPPVEAVPALPDLPEAAIPANLSAIFHNLLDFRELFGKAGIPLKGEDFAFYDPNREVLFISCESAETWDCIEQLFTGSVDFTPQPNIESNAWLADSASPDKPSVKVAIHSQSGANAEMDWTDSKKRPIASFHIEAVWGESGEILDFPYNFVARLPRKSPEALWNSKSKGILTNGVPLLSEATKLPDGTRIQQGLRATVEPVLPVPPIDEIPASVQFPPPQS